MFIDILSFIKALTLDFLMSFRKWNTNVFFSKSTVPTVKVIP